MKSYRLEENISKIYEKGIVFGIYKELLKPNKKENSIKKQVKNLNAS